MEIIVCIKQVPGTSEVEVDPETGVLKRSGIDSKMNPFDLYAIETALRIKQRHGAHIKVLSMGPPQAKEVIEEAIWMGADDGLLLSDRRFAGADVLATAYTLSQGVMTQGLPDLIICGKQTTDGDTAQVGPEMAEFLNIAHVANVNRIVEVASDGLAVDMDLPDSVLTVEVTFPCLITVEKGICEPRLPSFLRKMENKNKEVPVLGLADFEDTEETHYGLAGSPTQVRRIFPPDSNADQQIWQDAPDVLAHRLFDTLIGEKLI